MRIVALALLAAAPAVAAQSLAARVAAVGDGAAEISFAARSGVCGDGKNVVAMNSSLFIYPNVESRGTWSGVACVPGPVRVRVEVADRRVVSLRTRVGGRPGGGATDLGDVSTRAAADFLLGLAAAADGTVSRDAILPAAIADSVTVWPQLLRIARDADRPPETRRRALRWAGETGEGAAASEILAIARDAGESQKMRESALSALSMLPDGAGVSPLSQLVQSPDEPWLRKKAVFWLAQTEDARGLELLRRLGENADTPEEVRGEVIFALGHVSGTAADGAWLRAQYARLESPKLQERTIQSVAQIDDAENRRWLLALVRDPAEPMRTRKQALFWAGQQGVPLADLVALYDRLTETELKEHFTFVLSQRGEAAAADKLAAIARGDEDRAVRKKALFWLSQKGDPRATQIIRQIIER